MNIRPIRKKNEKQAEGTVVASPLVGIFYSAPSPEDEPFVTVAIP